MNKYSLVLPLALCISAGSLVSSVDAAPSSNAKLLGKWSMTSISGTTYWDKSTGAYMGSGFGGSQTYTFLPNGKYKFFNYIKTGSYGWETQALTWEEGTVAVSGSSLTLRPTTGRYQVMDNQVKKNNYTRPMRANERKVKKLTWKIESSNGKPVLRMGKDSSSLIEFKKQ